VIQRERKLVFGPERGGLPRNAGDCLGFGKIISTLLQVESPNRTIEAAYFDAAMIVREFGRYSNENRLGRVSLSCRRRTPAAT
jgi:hypothetical protein